MVRTLLVLGLTLFSIGAVPQQAPVNPLAQSMVDFKKRVDGYMKLRGEITKKVPEVKETGDPAKISGREKAWARRLPWPGRPPNRETSSETRCQPT